MSRTHRVFVYGTLLEGEANHHFLENAELLDANAELLDRSWSLVSLSSFPVLVPPDGRHPKLGPTRGEVYAVTNEELRELDRLEGVNPGGHGLYERRQLAVSGGEAWVYVMPGGVGARTYAVPITDGDWRKYRAATRRKEIVR